VVLFDGLASAAGRLAAVEDEERQQYDHDEQQQSAGDRHAHDQTTSRRRPRCKTQMHAAASIENT